MTGNELYRRVLSLLGYYGNETVKTDTNYLLKRALDVINQMCIDLKIPPIERLEQAIAADNKKLDALCYGTAMLLSLVEGDSAKNELFAKIYNAKRATALSACEKVEDKLPGVSYGVD